MLLRRLAVVMAVSLAQTTSLAWAQVTFEPKVVEGATYKSRDSQKIDQTLSLNGQNLPTKVDVNMVSQTTYGRRTPDGQLTYKTSFESIVADAELYGAKAKFDSAKADQK